MAARMLEVYLDLLSQPCRAVSLLLGCTNIPHTVRSVALRRGEHKKHSVLQTPDETEESHNIKPQPGGVADYLITSWMSFGCHGSSQWV
uniref:GST N-terminal domain-containing protein n=1 Tax=Acanthochromis polyacanthus TaxID=80966 RepID=A0A3Q1G343_9TELE